MKEIKAIIRHYKLEAVLNALHGHPEFPGVTVTPVRGFGKTVGRAKSQEVPVHYGTTEMVKLECVLNDQDVEAAIALIQQAAHTGIVGDGKIFVYPVDRAIKIRTGEQFTRIE